MKRILLLFIFLACTFTMAFSETAKVEIPDAVIQKNTDGNLELLVKYNGEISGLQLEMNYNPSQITLGQPVMSKKNQEFQVSSKTQDGKYISLVFSLSGKKLDFSSGYVFTIPLKPHTGFEGKVNIEITKLILSDPSGRGINFDKKIGEIKIADAIPKEFYVSPNFPNPFNPTTVIKYQIPKATDVSAVIYNLKGEEVRNLVQEFKNPGYYQIKWDGKNSKGQLVASGEYLFTLKTVENSHTAKMTFLK